MNESWSAKITNDPDNEYALYIELLEAGEYRGRIVRKAEGDLSLLVYGGNSDLEIPALWLLGIIEGARKDL